MDNSLFLIFVVPIIVDVLGTVGGQDKSYWKSKYKKFDEAVPIAHLWLQTHPLLFIVLCLAIWLPFTYFLILYLPHPFNVWGAMALFAGHAYNSVGWFRKTLYNWGIFAGQDRISLTLSLIPMSIYVLVIGYLAALGILQYFNA